MPMTYRHPSLLTDLLAADAQACAHGCCLEPRLVEMLLDRHACTTSDDTNVTPLGRPVRHDGPPQRHASGITRIGLAAGLAPYSQGASHGPR